MSKHTYRLIGFLLALMVLPGCSGGARHMAKPYVLVDNPCPIEVTVNLKKGESARGTVYYRQGGEHSYDQKPLLARGGGRNLSATLPQSLSQADHTIEYYIDVTTDNKEYPLRSPAYPYRVDVLTMEQLVLEKVHATIDHSYEGESVTFNLYTEGLVADHAHLTYQAPGIPGQTNTPMQRENNGVWSVTVAGQYVNAGWWNYRIETEVEGFALHFPDDQDWDSFEVTYPPEPVHHDHHDHQNDHGKEYKRHQSNNTPYDNEYIFHYTRCYDIGVKFQTKYCGGKPATPQVANALIEKLKDGKKIKSLLAHQGARKGLKHGLMGRSRMVQ